MYEEEWNYDEGYGNEASQDYNPEWNEKEEEWGQGADDSNYDDEHGEGSKSRNNNSRFPPPPSRNHWLVRRRWRRAYLHVTYNRYQKLLSQQEAHEKAEAFLTSLQKKKGVVPGIAAAEEELNNNPAPKPRMLYRAYARMGILYFEEGEYLKAIEWLNLICQIRTHDWKLFRVCGQAYIRLFEEEPVKVRESI
jgi:tetratricopeptide (TPR) repeat protein